MDFWSRKPFLRTQEEIGLEVETDIIVEPPVPVELQEPPQVEDQVVVEKPVKIEPDESVWKNCTKFYIENYVETHLCGWSVYENQEEQFVKFLQSNQVTHLDLSGSTISKKLVSLILKNCPNIIEINVTYTQFDSGFFEEIKTHTNLIYVHAQDTCLTQADHAQLKAILEEKIAANDQTSRIMPKLTI